MPQITTRTGKGSSVSQSEDQGNLDANAGFNIASTGTTRAITVADQNNTVELTNASPIAVTLDTIAIITTAAHTADFTVTLKNIGAGLVTVTSGGSDTFENGETSIIIPQYSSAVIQSDSSLTMWNIIAEKPSGWSLLSSKTASASATIDFTASDGIGANYDRYKIEFYNIPTALSRILQGRISSSGIFLTASQYTNDGTGEISYMVLSNKAGTAVAGATSGVVKFDLGKNSGNTRMASLRSETSIVFGGGMTTTSSCAYDVGNSTVTIIDGYRFYMDSGNIAEGEFRLFGWS